MEEVSVAIKLYINWTKLTITLFESLHVTMTRYVRLPLRLYICLVRSQDSLTTLAWLVRLTLSLTGYGFTVNSKTDINTFSQRKYFEAIT